MATINLIFSIFLFQSFVENPVFLLSCEGEDDCSIIILKNDSSVEFMKYGKLMKDPPIKNWLLDENNLELRGIDNYHLSFLKDSLGKIELFVSDSISKDWKLQYSDLFNSVKNDSVVRMFNSYEITPSNNSELLLEIVRHRQYDIISEKKINIKGVLIVIPKRSVPKKWHSKLE